MCPKEECETKTTLIFNEIRDAVDLSQNCENRSMRDAPEVLRAACIHDRTNERTMDNNNVRSWVIRLTLMKCTIFLVHFCFVNLTKFLIFHNQQQQR